MPRSFWLPKSDGDVLLQRPTLYNLDDVLKKHIDPSSRNIKRLDEFLVDFTVQIIETEKSDDFVYEMHDNDVLYVSARVIWDALFRLLNESDVTFINKQVEKDVQDAEKIKENDGWIHFLMIYGHKSQEKYLPQVSQSCEFRHKLAMYKLNEEAAELENEKKRLEIEVLRKQLGRPSKRGRESDDDDE
ncbi:hypothetical protein GUITHDRAFT_146914 [Guillardia theta CCMP2712]|uniref:Uncharacterized protein n=1 Tax=Guillardia theta (strain CCMP2712) TaxID=905079 RepID=L1IG65_GUITC|nr:hypothetical protein GUITHDRAFT_146914 [Guillardia theta CCMP2712]EKX34800.1 hypothetical protein GUITHDRAFT_146914 [Guillardia theta CCMP2712]|eukprot:XP_005821780.1 hypothetical protein GUITHDRAFT_146914 [Guillardia theta CCMP2712]